MQMNTMNFVQGSSSPGRTEYVWRRANRSEAVAQCHEGQKTYLWTWLMSSKWKEEMVITDFLSPFILYESPRKGNKIRLIASPSAHLDVQLHGVALAVRRTESRREATVSATHTRAARAVHIPGNCTDHHLHSEGSPWEVPGPARWVSR